MERLSALAGDAAQNLERFAALVQPGRRSSSVVQDGVRDELACLYLQNASLDATQVAYLLGYSELRAFKRWSGASPTEWRAAQRKG